MGQVAVPETGDSVPVRTSVPEQLKPHKKLGLIVCTQNADLVLIRYLFSFTGCYDYLLLYRPLLGIRSGLGTALFCRIRIQSVSEIK
jgi:hypothetical protein